MTKISYASAVAATGDDLINVKTIGVSLPKMY
jgi:hypothetical protein